MPCEQLRPYSSSVAFLINNGGYNNIYICTSDRGCGLINSNGTDQFLAGTAAAVRNGTGQPDYWYSYNTYSILPRQKPLITEAIYFPPGQAAIGAGTSSGIEPTNWLVHNTRCLAQQCYAAGDYIGIASNPYAGASTPFVREYNLKNALLQIFLQDPPGDAPGTFIPNFVPFPLGSDLTHLARPVPRSAVGSVDPRSRRGPR